VPSALANPHNARGLAHREDLSAHSDIVDVLLDAVQPLGDVQLYCPDLAAYRYVIAATNAVVFGFAVGMSTVSFRFDERMTARALQTGGEAVPECGDEWVAVVHHRPDAAWPAVDVRFWGAPRVHVRAYATALIVAVIDDMPGPGRAHSRAMTRSAKSSITRYCRLSGG
jgi:hypothetical protein